MTPINVLAVDAAQPDGDIIKQVARTLTAGGLVVAPTETRYGLLARADRPDVLQRLYEAKRRSLDLPTAVFVATVDHIGEVGEVTALARRLIERFLPGPLTVVLRPAGNWGAPRVVNEMTGVRVSSSPLIAQLTGTVTFPLTATSANISGQPERAAVQAIVEDLGESVDMYLDGGNLSGPVSTVVDCTGATVRILREGAVSRQQIMKVLEIPNV
ncbi:MAG: threonylcarbamoyl-AMP synthase [candidate division Zixibacteria bacterium]|nr:threonylcarbamoyl-AMP synthase [candidate division Zixibacteria bacterium]